MENNLTTEDKKAFKLFGIESVIILLLIIVILVILSFLGVLPWRSFIPGGSKQPATITVFPKNIVKQGSEKMLQPTIIESSVKGTPNISVVSDKDGYSLNLLDKEGLLKVIDDNWDVYNKMYNIPGKGNTGKDPVTLINVHLTGKEQVGNQYSANGKVYTSSNIEFKPSVLDVYIYLSDEKLNSDLGPEEKGSYITSSLLTAISTFDRFTIKQEPLDNTNSKTLQQIFKEIALSGNKYFSID